MPRDPLQPLLQALARHRAAGLGRARRGMGGGGGLATDRATGHAPAWLPTCTCQLWSLMLTRSSTSLSSCTVRASGRSCKKGERARRLACPSTTTAAPQALGATGLRAKPASPDPSPVPPLLALQLPPSCPPSRWPSSHLLVGKDQDARPGKLGAGQDVGQLLAGDSHASAVCGVHHDDHRIRAGVVGRPAEAE